MDLFKDIIEYKMGHDYEWRDKDGNCLHSGFLSYNFHIFKQYWSIKDAHGHTGKTIKHQIQQILPRMTNINAEMRDNEDEWTKTPEVFKIHLISILNETLKYPEARLYSDSVYEVKRYENINYESDGSEEFGEEE